jgi:transcriptional regulator with XRE-family HTH domain
MSTFGKRLKQLRNENDKTLDEMKVILETTKATLSRYENDKLSPKIHFAKKAAGYFNVSLDYIMGSTDDRNSDMYVGSKKPVLIEEVLEELSEQELKKYNNLNQEEKNNFLIKYYNRKNYAFFPSERIKDKVDLKLAIKVIAENNKIPIDILEETLQLLKKIYEKNNLYE